MRPLVSALACLLAASSQARADSLAEAAQRREQQFREAVFEVEVHEFLASGQLGVLEPRPGTAPPKAPDPPADVEAKSTSRVVYGKDFVRFENNHPIWSLSRHEHLPTRTVVVVTPDVSKQLFPKGISGRVGPEAIIGGPSTEALRPPALTPLHVHCRGTNAGVTPYLVTEATRSDSVLTVAGARCREYRLPAAGDTTISLFVDEGAGYVTRRVRKMKFGKLTYQSDVAYQSTAGAVVPASWTVSEFKADGNLVRRLSVRASLVSLNAGLPESAREVVFPEGCEVHDQRTRADYVVRSDGMMKELDRAGNDSGSVVPQPGAPWYQRVRVSYRYGAAAVALVAITAVYRKKRAAPQGGAAGGRPALPAGADA